MFFSNSEFQKDYDYAKEEWNNEYERELEQETCSDCYHTDMDAITHQMGQQLSFHPKPSTDLHRYKSHPTDHGNLDDIGNIQYHEAARKESEKIFNQTWCQKEKVRAQQRHNAPFTRIKQALWRVQSASIQILKCIRMKSRLS
jgi:hypothetical protein